MFAETALRPFFMRGTLQIWGSETKIQKTEGGQNTTQTNGVIAKETDGTKVQQP